MKNIFNQHDIKLEPNDHKYIDNIFPDQKYESVTEVIGKYFSPFDSKAIATNLIKKYSKYKDRTVDSIINEWNEAAEDGNTVHKQLDDYFKKGKIPIHHKSLLALEFYSKYKKKYSMDILSEPIIFSREIGIAASADLLTFNHKTNEVEIIDWKTGKEEIVSYKEQMCSHELTKDLMDCKFEKYTMQLSLYRYMLEKYYGLKVINQIVAHINDYTCKAYVAPYRKSHIENIINNLKK